MRAAFSAPGRVIGAGLIGLLLSLGLSACNFSTAAPTITPLPTLPPTASQTASASPTVTDTALPSDTATLMTPSATASLTLTASQTVTPTSSPTITPTAAPSWTPAATAGLAGDHLIRLTVPKEVTAALGQQWIVYANIADVKPPSLTKTPGTPAPYYASEASTQETIYYAAPDGTKSIAVATLPASVNQQIYVSPNGTYIAYFLGDSNAPGLYLLDLKSQLSQRIFAVSDTTGSSDSNGTPVPAASLSARGFAVSPVWSPDSKQVTTMLTTPYAVGIFDLNADGTSFRQMPDASDSYDLWPSWSPDGSSLAFVSDRAQCPSWTPDQPNTCAKPGATAPTGGGLYLVDASGKQVRLLSTAAQVITSPPHWISATRIAYTVGGNLWWVDVRDNTTHQVTKYPSDNSVQALRDSWAPDGQAVVYQEAGLSTQIVLKNSDGTPIDTLKGFNFPRISFSAAWSPDAQLIAIGGHNGQCPYGLLITDNQFKVKFKMDPAPGVCDPIWSPDGKYIAVAGITQSTGSTSARDGRYDLYVANATGFGIHNLSGRLGGQIRIFGWVSGS